jgi:hypothetical protein
MLAHRDSKCQRLHREAGCVACQGGCDAKQRTEVRVQTARVNAAAEVGSLRVAAMMQEQAFRLDVAVDNVFAMAINRSTSELLDVKGRSQICPLENAQIVSDSRTIRAWRRIQE